MFSFHVTLVVFLLLLSFHISKPQRRIHHGLTAKSQKRYMVYLTKADKSEVEYDNWICGGAIVTPDYIVTSAACVEDVKFMYAVAGYRRYVRPGSRSFDADECITSSKKKIVFTCLPQKYQFDYDRTEKWSYIDIAVVKVESPYDFETQLKYCSWIPNAIPISYDSQHVKAGVDALVLGWGARKKWRTPEDTDDHNEECLQYASVKVAEKCDCLKAYEAVPNLDKTINKYMICSTKRGTLDDEGNEILHPIPLNDGCFPIDDKYPGRTTCDQEFAMYYYDGMRRSVFNGTLIGRRNSDSNYTLIAHNYDEEDSLVTLNNTLKDNHNKSINNNESFTTKETFKKITESKIFGSARKNNVEYIVHEGPSKRQEHDHRKHGICQNDHGGPLVTWVGSEEYLIGVASVFLVDGNGSCVGPWLYTSTQCSGAFIGCVLGNEDEDEEIPDTETTPSNSETTENIKFLKARLKYLESQMSMSDNTRKNSSRRAALRERTRKYMPTTFDFSICHLPAYKLGYEIVRRRISWVNHPDGPAVNEADREIFMERPQLPLDQFQRSEEIPSEETEEEYEDTLSF